MKISCKVSLPAYAAFSLLIAIIPAAGCSRDSSDLTKNRIDGTVKSGNERVGDDVFVFPLPCEDSVVECRGAHIDCPGGPYKSFPNTGENAKRSNWLSARQDAENYVAKIDELVQKIGMNSDANRKELRDDLYIFLRKIEGWHKNNVETDKVERSIMRGDGLTDVGNKKHVLEILGRLRYSLLKTIQKIEGEYPKEEQLTGNHSSPCFEYSKGCSFLQEDGEYID